MAMTPAAVALNQGFFSDGLGHTRKRPAIPVPSLYLVFERQAFFPI
jgi:hypothetical protein